MALTSPVEEPRNAGGKSPREVRRMFARVAPRYDFLNHLLSLGRDRYWRAVAAREVAATPEGEWLADLCAGTGDLAFAFLDAAPGARVVALDFTPEMAARGREKAARAREKAAARRPAALCFGLGDALRLPLRDGSVAAAGVAFGLRNVSDADAALREMARVVRPGGKVLVLEFTQPAGRVFGPLFLFYFRRVLPLLGRAVACSSGDAYRYLPQSVAAFAGLGELTERMRAAGLTAVRAQPLTSGVVHLYVGIKPAGGEREGAAG